MSAQGQQIGGYFVEFSQKGIEALKAAFAGVQNDLNTITTATNALIAPIENMARAGLSASAMGQQLSFVMDQLARTVAGIFGPEIQQVTELLRQLTTWIQGLSEETKASIAHWVLVAMAASAAAAILPKVSAAFTAVRVAVRLVSSAFVGLNIVTGGLLIAVGAIAAAIVGLVEGTDSWSGAFRSMAETLRPFLAAIGEVWDAIKNLLLPVVQLFFDIWKAVGSFILTIVVPVLKVMAAVLNGMAKAIRWVVDGLRWLFGMGPMTWGEGPNEGRQRRGGRGQLAPRGGGFEAVGQDWFRMAEQMRNASIGRVDPQERIAENTAATNERLERIEQTLRRLQPAVV